MENKEKPNNEKKRPFNKYIKYTNIGFQMLAIIGLGVLLGQHLDSRYETSKPWYTMLFSLLGALIAIVLTIREVLREKP